MAAQELLLLLLTLLSDVHAELLRRQAMSHRFHLDDTADFCSVSRWTGDGKEILWNSSASYYELKPLAVSHSGQYQQQCWTRGNVTLERNSTLLVCGTRKMRHHVIYYPNDGQLVQMACDGVGPNQRVQWAYFKYSADGLVIINDDTPSTFGLKLLKNEPSLLLLRPTTNAARRQYYFCLEKQQHRCDILGYFLVHEKAEYLFRSVGDSLELNCSDGSRNQTHEWLMRHFHKSSERKTLNSTLMFPSLALNHTGSYICKLNASRREPYYLMVCPEPEPPAVVLFTEGENLTLHCGDWDKDIQLHWFIRSNRTGGQVSRVHDYQPLDGVYRSDGRLVIRNVSLQDSGRASCVLLKKGLLCVLRSEFLVRLREPELDHHLLRTVLLSVVILMMLCVVVVVGVMGRRRGEELPAPVEEQEMSQLSPESGGRDETPD